MNCPTCNRPMVPVFFSMSCDWCDAPTQNTGSVGWVLRYAWDEAEYVFRTRMDCERWREASGRQSCEPIMVHLSQPAVWQLARGSLRDVVLATQMHVLKQDHRHLVSEVPTCWPIS